MLDVHLHVKIIIINSFLSRIVLIFLYEVTLDFYPIIMI